MHLSRLGRSRRSALVGAGALVTAVAMAVFAAPASAAVVDNFELEGDVLDAASPTVPDWGAGANTSIFTLPSANAVPVPRDPLVSPFFDAGFARDFIPGSTSDTTAFTGGGSKDINNTSSWLCRTESNITDKGDIQNAYAAVATVGGHLLLYFGMEKNAPNGDNNMGVWFLQDGTVGCDGTGVGGSGKSFTGNHTDGDIFLVAAFLNGGTNPQVTAFKWVGGAGGALSAGVVSGGKCGTSGSENLCAITNLASVTTPWQTTNKGSITPQNKTGQGTTLDAAQFYEGAIDLTANHLDVDSNGDPICTNKFLFNTRSSQSTTASLYDFAEGDVSTCFSPTLTTQLYKDNPPTGPDAGDTALPANGNHTVTLPQLVYDTSTLSGGAPDPTGTITYSLWTNNTCTTASTDPTFSNGTNTSDPVTVGTASPSLLFTAAGDYWWTAHYTPSAGSRNSSADSSCTTEPLTVVKPKPTIATTPSATVIVIGNGNSFTDTATVSGGYFPSGGIAVGKVEFKLYGPFSSAPGAGDCTSTIKSEQIDATRVTDSTATATSTAYTPTAVGIYQWTAQYLGNAQNQASDVSSCGDTSEQVTVQPVTPTIETTILLSDKVKVTGVSGAGAISGTATFTLYPSLDCTGTPVTGGTFSNVTLVNGEAQTGTPVAVAAGSYSWKVQFIPTAGSNYTGVTTTCSPAADEQATITYQAPSPIG
jgi:hypothetical protein